MRRLVEELDYRPTAMGPLSLRRRWVSAIDADVYEVMLGDEHLMSSLFTVGETQLAVLGLEWARGKALRVLIGGLGLGYTAQAALSDPRVAAVEVVDVQPAVIDWHRQGLTPLGRTLAEDPRCRLTHADFFKGFEGPPGRRDVILLDIDHSPSRWLAPAHQAFYGVDSLGRMRDSLAQDGVFALWSDDPPDPVFLERLGSVFSVVDAPEVAFDNPLTGEPSRCTIYRGRR
ncbi:MAG: spermidine synthase [Brevundimonas sp.]